MNSEWPVVRLGDYCLKIGSGATPRGGKSVYLDAGETTLIRSQNIYNDGFTADGLVYITKSAADKLNNVEVLAGDILLNITGDSVARVCIAPTEYLPARVNQHVSIIRPDPEDFDARFLRYFLVSPEQQELLLIIASAGATRNALTKGHIESLEISKPSLAIQTGIADQLETLDKKIEINHQINQTLEQMAQAIFKSWFVDFEPVKAKIAALEAGGSEDDALLAAMQVISGKDPQQLTQLQTENPEHYTTLRATAELFPAAMQESELGEIPVGWFLPSFEELTTAKQGRYLSKDKMLAEANEEFKVPVWGGNGILGYAEKSAYSSPVVLMTCRGSNCGLIKYTESASWVSNNSFACTPCIGSSWFLLNYFQLSTFEDCISGSAQPQITHTALKTKQLKFPVQQQLCEQYSEIINPIFDHILQLKKEIITLKETRDTLLPKLLSGELAIADAE